ncbi:hypothetical protein SCLCIDRAFT_109543 [Scleroderma citrinum Foug A]|uniref:Uncharacterized protein n=1 Tax=Scleroderma citrinum Foug A TaxID=1036808 RepID=A0A0C3EG48_9AGAM|nr:hypothetical protein SCLCIDRAFT_109543 [Scleroderma citrinum Foug A]
MPHKRAKRSTREKDRLLRGIDLAPQKSLADEPIPKSVSRVLDSARIRREYREKKRKSDDCDNDIPQGKRRRQHVNNEGDEGTLKIKPGETIAHFNKRVEGSMMPLIKTALRHSSTQQRKVRKQEARQVRFGEQTADQSDSKSCSDPSQNVASVAASGAKPNSRERDREFSKASTAAPRRLNDTVQAPPDITKFPRGSRQLRNDKDKSSGVLSMAQKVMMEEERERAIKHYRGLKARRLCGDAVVTARVAIP